MFPSSFLETETETYPEPFQYVLPFFFPFWTIPPPFTRKFVPSLPVHLFPPCCLTFQLSRGTFFFRGQCICGSSFRTLFSPPSGQSLRDSCRPPFLSFFSVPFSLISHLPQRFSGETCLLLFFRLMQHCSFLTISYLQQSFSWNWADGFPLCFCFPALCEQLTEVFGNSFLCRICLYLLRGCPSGTFFLFPPKSLNCSFFSFFCEIMQFGFLISTCLPPLRCGCAFFLRRQPLAIRSIGAL